MATALVTQIAYAVQTLFDPAGTAGRLVDLGKLANYGLLGGAAPTVWLPSELFTTGVNGAWYDQSDMTTLFQDAAGTTPVTAVEQPVGLMKDKSGRGNHAFNNSGNSANFPVLSARYNLLTKSEHILDASIGQYLTTKISNTSWTFEAPGASRLYWGLSSNLTVGVSYRLSATFSAADIGKKIRFAYYDTGYNISPTDIIIDSNGYAEWVFTAVANTGIVSIYSASAGGAITYTFASSKGFSCTVANDALNQPAYQRVNTASDYDTVGFKPYLKFNGVNQWLQTNSIDFTSTAQMFVSAGVRKLSDAVAYGNIINFGWGSSGGFSIYGPSGAGTPRYAIGVWGSSWQAVYDVQTYAAPITNVVSLIGDLSQSTLAATLTPRIDGVVNRTNGTGTAGVATFANKMVVIGKDYSNAKEYFNGRIYQLVVCGKQATASEITNTETYLNQKTGAY